MSGKLNRIMVGYSAIVTTILAGAFATQAISGTKVDSLGEIDVERINVRETDGTLRLVISNTDKMPGIIHKGTNYPHPNRRTAGMLFFNEEGTENGGLTFGGRRDANGKVVGSSGHLSFDQFEQDQVVALTHGENDGQRRSGLSISDRPENAMPFAEMGAFTKLAPAEQKAMVDKWVAEKRLGNTPRAFIGRSVDRSSAVMLSDAEGKPRILMQVKADGEAAIQFLDAAGKVTKTVSPTSE
ncbi:hypothetical protein [Sphingosinicella rhizophila]|uniref:Uncharacterized protein n=1 Tax=Sphingosinicella rhizophila TaxID=3050082 RepID=A0ABU3QCQ3_9SPHN|nr:hypothetical protein [Sphingosinicella sp. GR2756]MDT9600763.1 hypothetical protein [Sphingosinicella sp. GR2756]